MIKFLFLGSFLLFSACASNLPQVQVKQHFLWKISDENSSLWLLGSLHFADSSFYPLDAVIENAFASSEELAVEINTGDDSVSQELFDQTLQQGLLPAGTSLSQVLPRALWNSLDSLCSVWNFPVAGLLRLRPWLAATTLSSFAIQRIGVAPEHGIDAVLLERAVIEGKGIVELETAVEQVNALSVSEDSDSAGIFYLKTTLQEIADLDSIVSQMMYAWKVGDDHLFREVLNRDRSYGDSSDVDIQKLVDDKIYTSRNKKMADAIASFLKEDRSIFVVVGAAHLILDEDSVVDLLRRKGFKVERY